ncbi:MAG: hypothetical protein KME26_00050 [Oscillatoria princeps RMCB-10]|nr:hypothetical protein [Oscillatoria princeps RMCB-10]
MLLRIQQTATTPQVKVDAVKFFLQPAGDLQQDGATGHKAQLPRSPATPPSETLAENLWFGTLAET